MLRRGILARTVLTVLLTLALLLPAGLAWTDAAHVCSCGMRKGSCFCDLLAKGGKSAHGSAAGCSLGSHGKSPGSSQPRLSLDLRQRPGVLAPSLPAFVASPDRMAVERPRRLPRSLTPSPETPPPRLSDPAS